MKIHFINLPDMARHDLHADAFTSGVNQLDHPAVTEAGDQAFINVKGVAQGNSFLILY